MKYEIFGNRDLPEEQRATPQGKQRIYFTCHPGDCNFFDSVCDMIWKHHRDCAVFYDEDPDNPEDMDNFESNIDCMQLIVIAVTRKFIYQETTANTVLKYAVKKHIPVLPVFKEPEIEMEFSRKFGDLQGLSPDSSDATQISFDEKLKKFLDSVLVGNELIEQIRAAFDA